MLICGCLLMLILGSVFSWSVFKKPLQAAFGWNDSELSAPFTVCMIFFTFGAVAAARLIKKFSIRVIVLIAGAIAFAGLLTASRVTAPWQMNIAYGFCMGTAVGMDYNCIITSSNAWFTDKPGKISGILMMAFGCGSLVFAPLDNYLLATCGWSRTFLYLGIIVAAVSAAASFGISLPPADYDSPLPETVVEKFEGMDYTTPEMLRRPSFYLLLLWAVCSATIGYSFLNQAFMVASSIGMSDVASSLCVSLVSVCIGVSRVVCGALFDRKGGRWVIRSMSCVLVASMLCLIPALVLKTRPLMVAGMAVFGLGFGAASPLIVNFCRTFYGQKNFPMNYSLINFNAVFGALLSQIICGYVLVISGSYLVMMYCIAGVVAMIAVLSFIINRP